ncbi:MAG TPA: S9 family peptidase [Candidatus Polarisedimenticolia bacterium]|jgi:dipeptidyl-peptidase-4
MATRRPGPRTGLAAALLVLASALDAPAWGSAGEPAPLKDLDNDLIHGGQLDGRLPTGFKWSPDGSRLAFTRRPVETRTALLQLYEVATRKTVTLSLPGAGASAGEAAPISSFEWSPSSDAILVLSGGDLYLFEGLGDSRAPERPARRLTRTETEEKDARFSPDGTMIGFVRDHNIWVMDAATRGENQVTGGNPEGVSNGEIDWVYEEEFEIREGWWWSPDSARIAYLQFDQRNVPTYPIVDWIPTHPSVERQHYPKAGDANAVVKVGVVQARGAAPAGTPPPTRWIELGADTDIYVPRVAWTADEGTLAVQRLDRDQTRLEVLLCDVEDGAARRILEEFDPKWINVADDWWFPAGGDRFIWGSERDGHRHLYLYDMEGKLIRRLTQGPWDVTDLSAVVEKEGWIYFTSTEKSPLERHLYRVTFDGSSPRRLTGDEGWHTTWVAAAGGRYVDSFSTAMSPPALTLRAPGGALIDTLDEGMSKELAGYRRGKVEFREVPATDGVKLPAMITLPPDFDPSRKYPVLVYVYGGPHGQVVANQWAGARGLWHQMMAARGLVIWSLDNRGMGGRGHAWETPLYRAMGRQELADQLVGVAWLKGLPWVDASRIGIWGWSYGGYMTLYSLLNSPDTFRAGVAVAPVTDWKDYDTIYTERYMDRPVDNPDGYRDSAPLAKASSLKAPLLLVHGSSDDNVHMQNSVQILDAFISSGRPVEFMLYPRKNHSIPGPQSRTHLYEKITSFLTGHLMSPGGKP